MRTFRFRVSTTMLVVAAAVISLSLVGASPAAAATKCDIAAVATTLGPTEVMSLSVVKTTCKNGRSVVKAYHACRTANGVSGRCVKRVKGYACAERRTTVPTEFHATVTCVKGKATVKHAYRQTLG